MKKSLTELRTDYKKNKLNKNNLRKNPLRQLEAWLNEAVKAKVKEPTAMALATSPLQGKPSVRIVLLKDIDEKGLIFFTNYESRKGKEIAENPYASVLFFWSELERQVRVEGSVEKVSEKISDQYFNSRPFLSRLSAVVSPQSKQILSRTLLIEQVEKLKQSVSGEIIHRPEFWGGYRLIPSTVEFWQGRENRLHDRLLYKKIKRREGWQVVRLAP